MTATATIIDGRAIAEQVRAEVAREVAGWVADGHPPPGLATVLVGDDPASAIYVGGKQRATAEVGMRGFDHRLPDDASHAEVEAGGVVTVSFANGEERKLMADYAPLKKKEAA